MGKLTRKKFYVGLSLLTLIIGAVAAILIAQRLPTTQVTPPTPTKAAVQISDTPDPNPPAFGAIRQVGKILATNTHVYVAGTALFAGPSTGHGVPISTTTGEVLPNHVAKIFNDRGGAVRTAIPDGSGGWYVGGNFDIFLTQYFGVNDNQFTVPITNLVHVLANGTIDPNFRPNPESGIIIDSGSVNSLILTADKKTLYVGGFFTAIGGIGSFGYQGGVVRNNLAAIDVTTRSIASFNPNVNDLKNEAPNESVSDMKLSADESILYFVGTFTGVGGQVRNGVAAVNTSDGSLASFNPDPAFNPDVDDINSYETMVFNSGKTMMYVGGSFFSISGQARNRLAAIDITTGTISSFNPNVTGATITEIDTLALTSDNSTLYIGGIFTAIGGQARSALTSVDAASGAPTSFAPVLENVQFNLPIQVREMTISADGSTLYIGGLFSKVGTTNKYNFAALELPSGNLKSWGPDASFTVYTTTLSADGSSMFVGGQSESIGKLLFSPTIFRLSPSGSSTTIDYNFAPNTPQNNPNFVNDLTNDLALSKDGSKLYIGGKFTRFGGQTRNRLAAISTTDGSLDSFDPNVNEEILAMAMSPDGSTLYIGGGFTSVGGQTRNRVAAINTTTGAVTGFNANVSTIVNTLTISPDGSTLYIGGGFTTVGGQTRNRIAAVDAVTGTLMSTFNPNLDASVSSSKISPDGQTLYIGGSFSSIGGTTRSGFAAVKTSDGSVTSFTTSPDVLGSFGMEISADNKTLFVSGNFKNIGGQARNNLAALDAATGAVLSWNPVHVSPMYSQALTLALSPDNTKLYVGRVANWGFESFTISQAGPPPPTPTPTSQPVGGAQPTATPTPTPVPGQPTATPTPTLPPGVTPTATPTPTSQPVGGAQPTATPTPTPVPVGGQQPSPTPTPALITKLKPQPTTPVAATPTPPSLPQVGVDAPTVGLIGAGLFLFTLGLLLAF